MKTKLFKKDFLVLIAIQAVLLLIGLYALLANEEPNTFKIGVVIDSNQTEDFRALALYQKRFNKYGGKDNTELRIIIIDDKDGIENDFLSTVDFRENPNIILNRMRFLVLDKDIDKSHMNYRMSAVMSDNLRKFNVETNKETLKRLKGLDIIISSLPERLGDTRAIKRHLIREIPKHHYFDSNLSFGTRVHTGIAMNKIYDIELDNLTYQMDFFLWFRWEGNSSLDVDNIEFTNTITPSFLKDNNVSNSSIVSSSLMVKERDNNSNYMKYHIIGKFEALEFKNYALGEQNLPIRFRHQNKGIEELHYVKDMTDNSKGVFSQDKATTVKEWESLRFNVIENPSLYLNYTLTYSFFKNRVPLGDIRDIHGLKRMSEFTTRYAIKHVLFSVRGLESYLNGFFPLGEGRIHLPSMTAYLIFSLIVSLGLTYLRRQRILKSGWSHTAWVLNLLVIFAMLLCLEFVGSQLIFNIKMSVWGVENLDIVETIMKNLQIFIALLWWVIPAYYVTSATEQFIWCPIEERTKTEIPHVLRMFIITIVYVLALIGILAYVFEITTSSLMATSGAFAILFAILSKVDISNIVAGLGISFAKIFKLGDWVKIGDVEGQVIEMTPRSTKVLTFENSVVNIPNTSVGSAVIENMGDGFRLMVHLEIVPHDFIFVEKKLLEAVDRTSGVLNSPEPFVAFLGQGDSAQIFEVYFYIQDYSLKAYYVQAVWREVWSVCEEFKIEMSTPQREHFVKNLE